MKYLQIIHQTRDKCQEHKRKFKNSIARKQIVQLINKQEILIDISQKKANGQVMENFQCN
jgi:hypothetical protein